MLAFLEYIYFSPDMSRKWVLFSRTTFRYQQAAALNISFHYYQRIAGNKNNFTIQCTVQECLVLGAQCYTQFSTLETLTFIRRALKKSFRYKYSRVRYSFSEAFLKFIENHTQQSFRNSCRTQGKTTSSVLKKLMMISTQRNADFYLTSCIKNHIQYLTNLFFDPTYTEVPGPVH